MKLNKFTCFLAAIILAMPFTVCAKEKKKAPVNVKETAKANDLAIGISKCTQIGPPLARLKCFDELAGTEVKDKPNNEKPVENINGKWNVSVKPDPVDDIKTVTLQLKAEDERFWMVIRCKNNNTELYINWGRYLKVYTDLLERHKSTPVLIRIGKEEAKESHWSLSTDERATFHPDDSIIPFIKKLIVNDTLLAQVPGIANSTHRAIFDIKGLDNAIKPLKETCHWE